MAKFDDEERRKLRQEFARRYLHTDEARAKALVYKKQPKTLEHRLKISESVRRTLAAKFGRLP